MNLHVRQRDVVPGIAPVPLELAPCELAISAYIDPPRRHHGLAQGFPEIQQVDPAAVPETPLRIREVIHFPLCVEMRVPRAASTLSTRQATPPYPALPSYPH